MTLHAYLPQDRLRAIANNTTLPDRTSGSALFADISGFTALTESLRERLGARHGAEELSRQLGEVYSALIAEVEKYGGSVIGFAGDSMLCWFDERTTHDGALASIAGQSSADCAVSAALGMQSAIQAFPVLALKVSIASGGARRFLVGDRNIQLLDTLAGATVARTAVGEHLATKGDVVVDQATSSLLGDSLSVREWRVHEDGERYAAISKLERRYETSNPPGAETLTPVRQSLRPYLHKNIYDRDTSGEGSFLTEFRPCVALFLRFTGIDYESDSAETELDVFICDVQRIAARHGGTLMDITIGDKGSYAYVNFGALNTHEDDARRAARTATEIREATSLALQMGITQGLMRVGAHGSERRRVFAALGDEVNLAARLMTTASVDEILVSGHVHKAVTSQFTFEPRPPLPMKGKAEPLPVFALTGERRQRAIRLQEPNYALPMVGRTSELGIIDEKLDLAARGKAHIIGIVAEAGMGKSRLVAEAIRLAHRKGFAGYGGACQSDGANTPYLVWKTIWGAFFDVDPEAPLKKQIRLLETEIEDRAPRRAEALPLLGSMLNLDIPDNDFTGTLEPRDRNSVLHALLTECLKAAAMDEPILIVLEDVQWLDALSHDLLEELARAVPDSPICFLLAYRPPQLARLIAPRLEAMTAFTKIELHELTPAEAEQAIRAKLAQLYPSRTGAVPPLLVNKLLLRSQGNPFYLEELLNFLRDRGLDPRDPADLEKIELPDRLHTLVLSRIDQLSEHEKTTLRAASIIGRLFRAAWLAGYYPALGDVQHVQSDLEQLHKLEITLLDTAEPELAYLFKHIVTHEVTYESLPFATRTELHEQLAVYLEGIAAPVDMIAQHYGRSNNQAKQREYFGKAGDAARAAFANEAALDYYARLHPLLSDPGEQGRLHLKRAEVYFGWGRLAEAREHIALGLNSIGEPLPETAWQWWTRLPKEMIKQILYRLWFAISPIRDAAGTESPEIDGGELELTGVYELLIFVDALANQASFADFYYVLRALNLAESWRRKSPALARAYALMGAGVALLPVPLPVHRLAQGYLRRARATLARLDHPLTLAFVLYELGLHAIGNGNWEESEIAYEQALEISDRLGDRRNRALTMNNLGFLAYFRGRFDDSIKRYADIFKEGQASNHVEHQAWGLNGQAMNLLRLGQTTRANELLERALPLFDVIKDSSLTELLSQGMLADIHLRHGRFELARQAADSANRLLAQASIPIFTALDTYGTVANVYLILWEKSQAQHEKDPMKLLALRACRSLHQFARTYPLAKSRAFLRQGFYDWLDGKPRRARRAWHKSLTAAQKLAMPYDEALAYYEIGRHATGAEREENLAHAREIFQRLGVVADEIDRYG